MSKLELPGLATAHSHAFQRAMRGSAQRPGPRGSDDFWSWRQSMYSLAAELTPDSIYSISRVAYRELYSTGVRTVGEFHYVHHQPDGEPYEDRTILAEAVIRAARDEGLRIALLRVIYTRGGPGKAPEGVQRRFSDAFLDDAFADIDTLRSRYAGAGDVLIGVAPHSVRAVSPDELRPIADFAGARNMQLHMHVAEQPLEIEACVGETGYRPVQLLAERGVLSDRFVAVHATHLGAGEAKLLGQARAFACLCPTTERDLGDGLPNLHDLVAEGVRLTVGVDSHVIINPLEDLRCLELHERLRTGKRVVLPGGDETPAERLWRIGSTETEAACGFDRPGPRIAVDRSSPELALCRDGEVLDAVVYSASPRVFA